ncbi:hypothetical protein D6825_00260 [Candidatus Woesearchaeota archaeon]|nr:MAG: hypothetical protein D6825_00260 [Candidatus Woesearchaeota archaeon]
MKTRSSRLLFAKWYLAVLFLALFATWLWDSGRDSASIATSTVALSILVVLELAIRSLSVSVSKGKVVISRGLWNSRKESLSNPSCRLKKAWWQKPFRAGNVILRGDEGRIELCCIEDARKLCKVINEYATDK